MRHLRNHRVEGRKDEIRIHEPAGAPSVASLSKIEAMFDGHGAAALGEFFGKLQAASRFEPVMRFAVADPVTPGVYVAYRRFYSGMGGWHMLTIGPLGKLLKAYVGAIGTDEFFKLM